MKKLPRLLSRGTKPNEAALAKKVARMQKLILAKADRYASFIHDLKVVAIFLARLLVVVKFIYK